MKLSGFTSKEKLFLAGCIKSIILSDGKIENEELKDLEKIIEGFDFPDFEESLEKFENQIKNTEEFWSLSKTILKDEVKEQTLAILYELSLQEGYQSKNAKSFLQKLQNIWQIDYEAS